MIKQALLTGAMLTPATLCHAITLTVGTPNYTDNGTTLSPQFGILINFDDQTPFSTLASTAYAAKGVQSIASNNSSDPLTVYPYTGDCNVELCPALFPERQHIHVQLRTFHAGSDQPGFGSDQWSYSG